MSRIKINQDVTSDEYPLAIFPKKLCCFEMIMHAASINISVVTGPSLSLFQGNILFIDNVAEKNIAWTTWIISKLLISNESL